MVVVAVRSLRLGGSERCPPTRQAYLGAIPLGLGGVRGDKGGTALLRLRRPRIKIRGRRLFGQEAAAFQFTGRMPGASALADRRYGLTGHLSRCGDLDARAPTACESGKSGCEETGRLRLWNDRGSGGPESRDLSL